MVGGLGFEPRQAESESAVLPLDDPPTGGPLLYARKWPDSRITGGKGKCPATYGEVADSGAKIILSDPLELARSKHHLHYIPENA